MHTGQWLRRDCNSPFNIHLIGNDLGQLYQQSSFTMKTFYASNHADDIPMATSMLVADVGDKICCWQFSDFGDGLAILVTNILYMLA